MSGQLIKDAWSPLADNKPAIGKDLGGAGLGPKEDYADCVVAEYIWLDAAGVPRSKSKTLSKKPYDVDCCPVWNFDGSSTEQSTGDNSDVYLVPRSIFRDPFRGGNNVLVLAECFTWDMVPAPGNNRAAAAAVFEQYKDLDPWFGIEQEYTLMKPSTIGKSSKMPLGFNDDGSDPAPQGPYYTGAGTGIAIGRTVAEDHYAKCLYAGVKVAGINSEVMPGQWEFQVGPCRGLEMGDHLTVARYIMYRVTEDQGMQVSFDPKPKEGDWNGAGCHTNFSIIPMREEGGLAVIEKVCEEFGKVAKEHLDEYGEGNERRLTGLHETASITEFKYGVANRGCSIRIPRETAAAKKGYMEDRRPAANCDPYRVTRRMMLTTGLTMRLTS